MRKRISSLQYISQGENEVAHLCHIQNALEARCDWIQLRMKGYDLEKLEYAAGKAKALCDRFGAKLIINDYVHIARLVGADGVHLGLNDTSVAEARAILGTKAIIGGTANTFDDITQRVAEEVDYLGLGPFRFTKTKSNLSPILGIEGYQQLLTRMKVAMMDLPVIAIGGIQLSDLSALAEAGIYGVALSGAINKSENPKEMIKEIHLILDAAMRI